MRDFFPPLDLWKLEGSLVPLPQSIRGTCPPKFIRDSRTADSYLAGPISLVNHACSKHSNCVLNVTNGARLAADTYIMSGERLYICYSSDENEMSRIRGFKCGVCSRLQKLCIKLCTQNHNAAEKLAG